MPPELEDVSEAVPPLHIVVLAEMLMEGSATTVTVAQLLAMVVHPTPVAPTKQR